jgi:hypothetical protein
MYCSRHQAHLLSPRQSCHPFNLALQSHGGSWRTMELTVPPMAHDASTSSGSIDALRLLVASDSGVIQAGSLPPEAGFCSPGHKSGIVEPFLSSPTRSEQPDQPDKRNPDPNRPISAGFAYFYYCHGLKIPISDRHGSGGRTGRNPPEPTRAQPYM